MSVTALKLGSVGIAEEMSASDQLPTSSIPPVIPIVTYTGTAQTSALSDAGAEVRMNNSAANTYTVDPSLFAIGTRLMVRQSGAGQTTVAVAASGTLNKLAATAKLSGQWALAAVCVDSSTAITINGELAAS